MDRIKYERGHAMRVFDAFGGMGFNVDEDGRLGYFGPGGPWHANPGDWIVRHHGEMFHCDFEPTDETTWAEVVQPIRNWFSRRPRQ